MASHDANPVSLSYSVTVTAGYSDRHEPVMKILMGEYIAVGEHHGRTVFQRANKRAVFLYFGTTVTAHICQDGGSAALSKVQNFMPSRRRHQQSLRGTGGQFRAVAWPTLHFKS